MTKEIKKKRGKCKKCGIEINNDNWGRIDFINDVLFCRKCLKQVEKKEKEIKEKIRSGYPLEDYIFTGEFSEQIRGVNSRMALRNKKVYGYVPIYKNKIGRTISDMTQIVKQKPSLTHKRVCQKK